MTDQLELTFDPQAAARARDGGMDAAARADRVQAWKQQADAWLQTVRDDAEFTADDLVAAIGLPDQGAARNNVVGAWFGAQSKRGLIEFTGRLGTSSRVVGHGNLQRIWKRAG